MPRLGLVVLGIVLSGCASPRASVQKLGAYDALQPELVASRAGTRLRLARPAHVQILRVSSTGAERLYPAAPDQQAYFPAGSHAIDVPSLRLPPRGGCASYESSGSVFPDERAERAGGITRTNTRRGRPTTCTRSGARTEAYTSPTSRVLVLASGEPLPAERVSELVASFSSPGAEPTASAAALATRLSTAAGSRVWAAYVSTVRVQ